MHLHCISSRNKVKNQLNINENVPLHKLGKVNVMKKWWNVKATISTISQQMHLFAQKVGLLSTLGEWTAIGKFPEIPIAHRGEWQNTPAIVDRNSPRMPIAANTRRMYLGLERQPVPAPRYRFRASAGAVSFRFVYYSFHFFGTHCANARRGVLPLFFIFFRLRFIFLYHFIYFYFLFIFCIRRHFSP